MTKRRPDLEVAIQLHPDEYEERALRMVLEQYTDAYNEVVRAGWADYETNTFELHARTYQRIRERNPYFPSGLVTAARTEAASVLHAVLRAAFISGRGRDVVPPFREDWKKAHVRYNPTVLSFLTADGRFGEEMVSLATPIGRVRLLYSTPEGVRIGPGMEPRYAYLQLVEGEGGSAGSPLWMLYTRFGRPSEAEIAERERKKALWHAARRARQESRRVARRAQEDAAERWRDAGPTSLPDDQVMQKGHGRILSPLQQAWVEAGLLD